MIEGYEWIVELPGLVGIGLVGMLMHFLKQKIKGETITEIASYFSNNFKSTLIALTSTVIAVAGYYFALSTGQTADIIQAFSFGYMCDSFFNKWDKQP